MQSAQPTYYKYNKYFTPTQIKRRSVRALSVSERLNVLKEATRRDLTQEEIALKFNLKVQAIRDLLKCLRKKRSMFLKKKRDEQ